MDNEQYLNGLLAEIDRARNSGKKGVFRINNKVSDNIAKYARDYLISNTPYRIEFTKCSTCSQTWDILIIF